MSWIDGIERQLMHVCNGDVTRRNDVVVCKMDNGEVKVWETPDKTKVLVAKKGKDEDQETARLEMHHGKHDVPVITRSLSGSIELITRHGRNPSVIIRQDGRKLGSFSTYAYVDENKMMLEADY